MAESTLIKLSESDERIENGSADIRGLKVKDAGGEDIGTVDDLLIDPDADEVRFIVVASGGFLGIGQDETYIPVEAVTDISDDVSVDLSREKLEGAPGYDPELAPDRGYYDRVYGYYGYSPYWAPGYAAPPYAAFY
ncbi:PRC-barrel domain-containing protein [Salinibacterium sp. SYSU T00001]|uniref:PRC-barrel domain-containing protein n=1 Tax=Homoserinimonas sedimenticola TaxID=2986805 RepID=UPI002235B2FD|nr:PRC-barrel domain-containing protein [Salinibacterium sedimenticola]MCW4384555.1 PRC-barrel domain-containing protein [Salinibacterium sedimenticola]